MSCAYTSVSFTGGTAIVILNLTSKLTPRIEFTFEADKLGHRVAQNLEQRLLPLESSSLPHFEAKSISISTVLGLKLTS